MVSIWATPKIQALALGPAGRELVRKRQPTPAGDWHGGTLEAIRILGIGRQLGNSCRLDIGTDMPGLQEQFPVRLFTAG